MKISRLLVSLLFVSGLSLGLVSCVNPGGEYRYLDPAKVVEKTVKGKVISIRRIEYRPESSGLGSSIGSFGGAILGETVGGGGVAHALGFLGGAVAGGVTGWAVEDGINREYMTEYLIRRNDNGKVVAFTEEGKPRFRENESAYLAYHYTGQVDLISLR